ncbi:unnamed protein product [Peniophora sp. CBMAI 1063]|nr:unnamed protein product [Peniophora sp. CBMAI 1063]
MSSVFRLRSEVAYKGKDNYRPVVVAGDTFVRGALKKLVRVGAVSFERNGCQGNPVIAYFLRHGAAQGQAIPLSNKYTLTTPTTNKPYSGVSSGLNPIRVTPYFPGLRQLAQGEITFTYRIM